METDKQKCNQCRGVVASMEAAQNNLPTQQANAKVLKEFSQMREGTDCDENFVCLPLRRLQPPTKKIGN